ncbi:MAG: class II fructose-bisphosphate aldolase [Candidatus Omnitrophota bacterium]
MGRKPIDILDLARELVLTDDSEVKQKLGKKILNIAYKKGIYPSSINQLYFARGRGEFFPNFTVPAINLRTLTLDLARAIFRVAKKNNAGAFIFEIARSEMGYTGQPPVEYSVCVLAAAVCEGYQGPVFIQGDHFQLNAKKFRDNPEKEIGGLEILITQAVEAGFYNIDIDSSTLVDLSKSTVDKQQYLNYDTCAKLTQFIRKIQPRGIDISVGGEIGEVGGKNSTPEELRAFMSGFKKRLRKGKQGISKISVQTGTTHGGVVLPDGSIAQVQIDFDTLKNLSRISREEFGLAGCVQHGASTLPAEAFHKFAETEAAEVHLATEFQNMVYENSHLPEELRDRIYDWIKQNLSGERKQEQTEEQFIYTARKKALGQFKRDIFGLPQNIRDAIVAPVEEKFNFLFKQLNVVNTKELADKYINLKRVIRRTRHKKEEPGAQEHFEGAD